MRVELLGPLKRELGMGELEVRLGGRTTILDALRKLPEEVRKRVLEPGGRVAPGILVVVNGREAVSMGLDRVYVDDRDTVALIPVIHGGGGEAELAEFEGKWVAAAIYRNPVKEAVRDPTGLLERAGAGGRAVLQVFDAGTVISHIQVHAAAVAAELAFRAGSNVARSLGMEVLVRLAADTQIGRALRKVGVREESGEVGVCAIAESREEAEKAAEELARLLRGVRMSEEELRAMERVERALRFYGISSEVEVVQASSRWEAALLLILERISSTDLER